MLGLGRVQGIMPYLKTCSRLLTLHALCMLPVEAMTAELQVGPVCLCDFQAVL